MRFAIAACLLLALALPARAQDPREAELVKLAVDSSKSVEERADALKKARALVYQREPPRDGPLKDAIGPLLRGLSKSADDVTQVRLHAAALQSLKPFTPWAEVSSLVRPFLQPDVALRVRIEALLTVRDHGGQGLQKELIAMLSEQLPRRVKERFELTVLEAAKGLPAKEAAAVAAKALDDTRFRTVKLRAARNLAEKQSAAGKDALLRACNAQNRDEHVSSAAALSLLRYGTLEGLGQLVKRLEAREGDSVALYQAICRGAHKEDSGFGDVPPSKYLSVPAETRAQALTQLLAWWAGTEGKDPEDVMFAALRRKLGEKGIEVPKEKSDKRAVAALIAGLGIEPLSLRYSALEVLIELTGRADFFSDFRSILIKLGPNRMKLREWEPTYGFTDPARQGELRKEQAIKAEKFRQWWDSVKDRAEWVSGRWKVSG